MSERARQIFEDFKAAINESKRVLDQNLSVMRKQYPNLTEEELTGVLQLLHDFIINEGMENFADAIMKDLLPDEYDPFKLGELGTLVNGYPLEVHERLEVRELPEDELAECQMRENASHIMENLSPEGHKEAIEYYKRVSALSEDKRKELALRINEYTKQAVAELEGE
ncbi:MAG: hypothetical protein ABIA12_02520 [Candidatus Aenigmatarchaeota archaeon]